MSILDKVQSKAVVDKEGEPEPQGEHYRPVWRTTRPPSVDIRMGSLWFNIAYGHVLMIASAAEFFSAFWIITPNLTFICEGENLREVVTSLADRKARAIFLFEPDRHKSWDEKQGRILLMQQVVVPHEAAFRQAAPVFGFVLPEPPPAAKPAVAP
jgi:hypothetical protein